MTAPAPAPRNDHDTLNDVRRWLRRLSTDGYQHGFHAFEVEAFERLTQEMDSIYSRVVMGGVLQGPAEDEVEMLRRLA